MADEFLTHDVPSFGRNIRRTTSFPDGIDEEKSFSPHSISATRRTSSMEDIVRYHRYFKLVQANSGMLFTWTHYLDILWDELYSFDTFAITSKAKHSLLATSKSEISMYDTPSRSFTCHLQKVGLEGDVEQFSFGDTRKIESTSDEASSIPSERSSISFKSRGQLIKKMRKETRAFLRKISKSMNILSHLPEECIVCGAPLKTLDHKRHCVPFAEEVGDNGVRHKPRSQISIPDFNLQDQKRNEGGTVATRLSVTSS